MNRLVTRVIFAFFLYGASASPAQRIVGGAIARLDQIGATVSLLRHVPNTSTYRFHCAGALIYPHIVVSAAQCFDDMYLNPVSWRVRAGSLFHASGGGLTNAVGIIPHEDFDRESLNNDIALVNLGSPVTATQASIAPLPAATTLPATGIYGEIAGWGAILSTASTTSISARLYVANVEVSDRTVCLTNLLLVGVPVQDNQFCTTGLGAGICHNDIGSPIYNAGRLVGIASYHIGCGFDRFPAVYTATGPYVTWIENNVFG